MENEELTGREQASRQSREPTHGMVMVDDRPATSVRFKRVEKDDATTYDVSFHLGKDRVAQVKGLTADELENVVGEKNAKAIRDDDQAKGTLEGLRLQYEYGLTPQEQHAREQAKTARDVAEYYDAEQRRHTEQLQAFVAGAGRVEETKWDELSPQLQADLKEHWELSERVAYADASVRMGLDADAKGELANAEQELAAWAKAKGVSLPGAEQDGAHDVTAEPNVIEHVPEREREIGSGELAEGLAYLDEKRRREREALVQQQGEIGLQAEGKRIKVENLGEKAEEQDAGHDLAERLGEPTDRQDQLATEREKNRQIELMDQLHGQYRVAGAKFYFKDQPAKVAFKDRGEKLTSASNEERVAQAMAKMADARGWKTIKIDGHPDFMREVWLEASVRGIGVQGFKPEERDLRALEERRDRMMRNTVEHVETAPRERSERAKAAPAPAKGREAAGEAPQRTQAAETGKALVQEAQQPRQQPKRVYEGVVMDHGEAPYKNERDAKPSYFVKLLTKAGEQTVWGVDLKRAAGEGNVQTGDAVRLSYLGRTAVQVQEPVKNADGKVVKDREGRVQYQTVDTHRNAWNAEQSDRHKVLTAVAGEVAKAAFKDPAQQAAFTAQVQAELDKRASAGRLPAVQVYDKAAERSGPEKDRARPVVERQAERSR